MASVVNGGGGGVVAVNFRMKTRPQEIASPSESPGAQKGVVAFKNL